MVVSFDNLLTGKPGLRIVLADDDADDRDFFRDIVLQFHHAENINLVRDGKELLENLESDSVLPDLLFLDLNMPFVSGLECLKRIRDEEKYKKIKVVIFSTSGADPDIMKAFEYGADFYIVKPGNFRVLSKMIEKALILYHSNQLPVVEFKNFCIREN